MINLTPLLLLICYTFSKDFPFSVVKYFCKRLLGLLGTVIASNPSAIKGFMYLFLNLVRLLKCSNVIISISDFSDKQVSRIVCISP